jgi:hypothetical protein
VTTVEPAAPIQPAPPRGAEGGVVTAAFTVLGREHAQIFYS